MNGSGLPIQPRLARMFRLQYERVQTAWVLLYPEGMVRLNDSAAEILRRCDGTQTVDGIVRDLERQYAVQGIAGQVHGLLQEGMRRGWIY